MSNYKPVPEGKDPMLWEIAQKRANFKKHAVSYTIINIFLWALWYFTGYHSTTVDGYFIPWPVWTTIGWGFGLAYQFSAAYVFPKENATEREYEKLKSNHKSNN
ncbi:MAG: 2TM domain-containing protein [Ferruginibacter sp.]